jgi:hypothetical protein
MRIVRYHSFGGPEVPQVEEEAPVPTPGPRWATWWGGWRRPGRA